MILKSSNLAGLIKQFNVGRRQRIAKTLLVVIPENVGQCINVCFHIEFVVSKANIVKRRDFQELSKGISHLVIFNDLHLYAAYLNQVA
jgi:hypothetical protein